MGQWMDGYLAKLERLLQENLAGGGPERQQAQQALGKLSVRERIGHLTDPGSFEELGALVRDGRPPFDGRERPSPGDGVVMGFANIQGRPTAVYALDFSVMSGSLGDQAVWKLNDLTKMAGQMGVPLVGLIDSAGERISLKDGDSGLNGLGELLKNTCRVSGIIPRITLLLGPCTGVLAFLPVLSDFLIMGRETAFLWLGGEKSTKDGGRAGFHMERSGQCDLIAESDEAAIEQTKRLLTYIPPNCWENPTWVDTGDDPERREEALLEVMPDDPKFTYDIHEVIEKIVDRGEFLEFKEDFANHLVIGFGRFGGLTAGIVANNPDELSGILEPDSSDKYDRFMNFLDAFNLPLVTLVDTTAFPPGDRWERQGVIRHGAKLLHSYAHLTCPKITIVLRRSYGGANIVLGCSRMFPDFVYTWPTAEFAPTGPETVVQAVFHKELARAKEQGNFDQVYQRYLGVLQEQFSVLNLAKTWTSYYTTHEVIDPRDTRPRIARALRLTSQKREELPLKKRSIKPA
ncbi:MAG: propionyl-CoA carboxylase [Deltaproteobacteria bacterium]|nr:propionyl-CoA carboxylase [Deltaproteobacteria bacterium]